MGLQLRYLPVLATGLMLLMLRVLIVARVLDVPGFAHYSMGMVVASVFCMLGALGLYPLLQRDMPIQFARGRRRRAMVLLAQSLLVAAACAVVAMVAALLPRAVANLSGAAFIVALLNGLSQQAFLIATAESRSAGEPLRYARQNLWRGLAIVAASAAVAVLTGSASAVLGVEAMISVVMALAIVAGAAGRARMSAPLLCRLALARISRVPWRVASVFLGISTIMTLVANADRWLGAELLPVEEFAQYAFAATSVVLAQATQGMVNAAVYPMVGRRFATVGPLPAYRLAASASLVLLALAMLASVPAYFAAAWAIGWWYPDYRPAIGLLIPLLGVCCLRISDFWSGFLAASGHERRLLAINAGVALFGCGLWFAWRSAMDVRIDPQAIAWLAVLLTSLSYASVAVAATLSRRDGSPTAHGRAVERPAP